MNVCRALEFQVMLVSRLNPAVRGPEPWRDAFDQPLTLLAVMRAMRAMRAMQLVRFESMRLTIELGSRTATASTTQIERAGASLNA